MFLTFSIVPEFWSNKITIHVAVDHQLSPKKLIFKHWLIQIYTKGFKHTTIYFESHVEFVRKCFSKGHCKIWFTFLNLNNNFFLISVTIFLYFSTFISLFIRLYFWLPDHRMIDNALLSLVRKFNLKRCNPHMWPCVI